MEPFTENVFDLPEMREKIHVFADRNHAGQILGDMLLSFRESNAVLLGIPAGGLRTPAVPVATAAALTILFALDPAGTPPDGRTLTLAIVGGLLALVLFVPLDGGLRRLWGLAGENVVRALEQGSIGELRAFAPTALVLRVGAVTAGLVAIAWAFRELDVRLASWPAIDRLGALP